MIVAMLIYLQHKTLHLISCFRPSSFILQGSFFYVLTIFEWFLADKVNI